MSLENDDLVLLRELRDRTEIIHCLNRYCRGIDRRDAALAKSAYHADASDDHGSFIGNAHDFVDDVVASMPARWAATLHFISNHSLELDGDAAHVETYFLFSGRDAHDESQLHGGRYVDRFERREGLWAIAARVCVYEWGPDAARAAWGLANQIKGRFDDRDVSRIRPLQVTRTISDAERG